MQCVTGRPMRRKDREVADPDEIIGIMRDAQVCRVAMAGDDGPYVLPMSFGLGEGCIWLHAAAEGLKLEVLRGDPRVCVEFEADVELMRGKGPCDIGFRFRSALAFGRAEVVTDREEKRRGLEALVRQYAPDAGPVPDSAVERVTVLRVDVEHMTGKKAHC